MLPFGGYKGYGITLLVEILSGVLTGARFAPNVGGLYGGDRTPQNVGAFMAALRTDAFGVSSAEFAARMKSLASGIRSCERADGVERIFLPGEIEHEKRRSRLTLGIELPQHVADDLKTVAESLGVDPSPF